METQVAPGTVTETQPAQRTARRSSEYDERSKFVSIKDQHLVTGLSAVTVWRKRRRGQFPQPIKLSEGRVAFLRTDLERWVAERQHTK